MPNTHLVNQRPRNILHVKRPALFGDDRMKQHLQQHVAKLPAYRPVVACADRVIQLVRLFVQIGAK
jgi:hypothetical protein